MRKGGPRAARFHMAYCLFDFLGVSSLFSTRGAGGVSRLICDVMRAFDVWCDLSATANADTDNIKDTMIAAVLNILLTP